MKLKYNTVFALLFALVLPFSRQNTDILMRDDNPIFFNLTNKSLKIAQFTDLHLTFGFDANDQKTFRLIKKITEETKPDLIVLTGDQTLSVSSGARYHQLTRKMEELKTPWTFTFGNHDGDFKKKEFLLKRMNKNNPKYLYFKSGPVLDKGGYGNFVIQCFYEDTPFYNVYLLDSKSKIKGHRPGKFFLYDYFSDDQVEWYRSKVMSDKENNVKSTAFAHIPLMQFKEALLSENSTFVKGHINESISYQEIDTGFFRAMKESTVAEGFFAGHDHLNNFTYEKDGITLGYGQLSGYNGYGKGVKRGARIIEIDEEQNFSTYIVYEDLSYEY